VNIATPDPEDTVIGRLDGQVELEVSWRDHAAAFDALPQRQIGGKAVLRFDW
jgi:hypothetical protein